MSYSGYRIAITGAFGTLGQAVVAMALEAGARVAAIDYATASPLQQRDGLHILGGVDLTSAEGARQAFAQAADALGGLDSVVNIAGGFVWETFAGSTIESWDKMYSINVRTAVNSLQAALPWLLQDSRASVVNISANSALKSGMGVAAYTASKAAVAKLTESLADEFKGRIRVNAVLPSIIDTPVNRADMPAADFSSWVSPDELARVILFLISPSASAVTGALIPVVGRV